MQFDSMPSKGIIDALLYCKNCAKSNQRRITNSIYVLSVLRKLLTEYTGKGYRIGSEKERQTGNNSKSVMVLHKGVTMRIKIGCCGYSDEFSVYIVSVLSLWLLATLIDERSDKKC